MKIKPCTMPDCDNPKVPGQGQRYCQPCKTAAAEMLYHANIQRLRDWQAANPDRAKAARRRIAALPRYRAQRSAAKKRRREENPRQAWSDDLWQRFRITADDYEALLAAQGGGCALCGKRQGVQKRRLHVDHDHRCCPTVGKSCGKCVRGLLCRYCNNSLGWYERRREIIHEYAARRAEIAA